MMQVAAAAGDGPWPRRMADLAESERLVLSVFRHWLAGLAGNSGLCLSLAWNEMARELGAARGRAAMSGLIGLVRAMGHLRRPLRHHHPCCACVSGDENAVLGFLAACQRRDWALARGQAEGMVGPDGVGDLLESGGRLGAALSAGGFRLPARQGAGPILSHDTDNMPSVALH